MNIFYNVRAIYQFWLCWETHRGWIIGGSFGRVKNEHLDSDEDGAKTGEVETFRNQEFCHFLSRDELEILALTLVSKIDHHT